MKKIERQTLLLALGSQLRASRIVALVGPRQSGKSTLARNYASEHASKYRHVHFFDLEDPTDETLLQNPKLTLEKLEGLIIIDEVQRLPRLLPYLRVKADQMKSKTRILLLGSASRSLIEVASESLAGRISYLEIVPFGIDEVEDENKLFHRGGFPLSFLANSESASYQWRKSFLQSFTERDLRTLGFDLPPQGIRRYMEMLTGFHGQIFNASEIGRSLGLSHTTTRKYLDILVGTFGARELKPWHESIIQRQVKMPKIYIRDTGLLFCLMGLKTRAEIDRNPRLGSFWEGFALEATIRKYLMGQDDIYFWAIHQGGELDLLWKNGKNKIGFEFKYSDSPAVTKSMRQAVNLLKLNRLNIIYPGTKSAQIDDKIFLQPL